MYEIVSEPEGNAVGLRLRDPLEPDELREMGEFLSSAVAAQGTIHLLVEFPGLGTERVEEVGADLERGLGRRDGVERVAVVGDERRVPSPEALGRLFRDADVRQFDPPFLAEAWLWVRGKG
ncbi:MAG: STAS/SEC14 domain-containing protein [Gemmatimonadota bacterium]